VVKLRSLSLITGGSTMARSLNASIGSARTGAFFRFLLVSANFCLATSVSMTTIPAILTEILYINFLLRIAQALYA
jgi:hypothetical protein